ncbi:MAG: cysteine rich repeat-containing protein [Methylovirgula sp.]
MSRFSLLLTSLCAIAGLVMLVDIWTQTLPAEAQISDQMRAQLATVKDLCHADYAHFCAGVTPGGGRIVSCLKSHAGSLSPACAQGLAQAQAFKDRAAGVEIPR